jgi:hypothetical protein
LLFLTEIPVYLLLVQDHFSRSSPRPTTAFCRCDTDIAEHRKSSIFQSCKKLRVGFWNLEFDLSSAEFKLDTFPHVLNWRRPPPPPHRVPKSRNSRRPRCANMRRQHHERIGMLLFLPLPLLWRD